MKTAGCAKCDARLSIWERRHRVTRYEPGVYTHGSGGKAECWLCDKCYQVLQRAFKLLRKVV